MKMQVGKKYVVHAHLDDESYRIVASAKVDRYLSKEKAAYESGQEVDILIWQKTDLGFKAIINDEYSGLLYESEIFQPLDVYKRQVHTVEWWYWSMDSRFACLLSVVL